ncbi:MAG: extracellular solute-binding protein [Anaerolineae bacterium]|nr:extracellular solute-binding protein [Anaerolineae bacterium]
MRKTWLTSALALSVLLLALAGCAQQAAAPAAPAAAPTAAAAVKAAAPTVAAAVQQAAPTAAAAAKSGERPKMTVWLQKSFTPEADALQKKYVEDWAAAKGVDVTIVQDSSTVLNPQFNAAIESKNLPDVLTWASIDWAPKLERLGLTLDVTDVVNKMNSRGGGLQDAALRAVMKDGKAFAIPTHGATEIIYLRKDLADAKGIKPPETWEELFAAAKALTDKGKVWGYGEQLGTASFDAEIATLSKLAAYGASPYAADGKTPNLNNEGTRKLLAMIKDAWDAGAIPADAVTWDDSGNNKAYLTGAAAMVYNTGSILNAMRKDDPELLKKTLALPIPGGPQGKRQIQYVYGLIIPNTTKNPELAKDLVDYYTDPKRQADIVVAAGTNYMPMYKDLAKEPIWQDPTNKLLIDQLASTNAVGWPGPTTDWALEAWRQHTMTEMVDKVLVEGKSIDQAIQETEAKLVKIYEQFNKK